MRQLTLFNPLLLCSLGLFLISGCTTPALSPPPQTVCATPAIVPAAHCPACPVCAGTTQPPPPAAPKAPPLQPASWHNLPGWQDEYTQETLAAFRTSCTVLSSQAAWQAACEAAQAMRSTASANRSRQFFESHFTPWQLTNPDGSTNGLITGYYEPLIQGSRTYSENYPWPIHAVPDDMLTIDLGELYPEIKNMRLRGRLVGQKIVPYWSRSELEAQGKALPAKILLWAADPIELFFLQVQGSGRVQLPNGTQVRIGYADQNGHPYHSIGRWLVEQGELPLEKASMDGIKAWAQHNPARLSELLNVNPSYVFFRELNTDNEGPVGAQGVPITKERTLAVDARFTPLGAPVFLSTTYPLSNQTLNRLMIAQDTGGAIKGPVRADFFWGFGSTAGKQAGRMRQTGQMWVLLPKGVEPQDLR